MSALTRIADSSRTCRQFRKVPIREELAAAISGHGTFMTFLYCRPVSPLDFICRQTNFSRAVENRDRTGWRISLVCAGCCSETARPFCGLDVEKIDALGRAARRPFKC